MWFREEVLLTTLPERSVASEPSKHLKDGLRRCLINRGKLPPVETRWKPGQSGNPKGRPKKEKLLEPLIRELLESKRRGDKEGRQWKMIVAEELLRQFTKGNPVAIKEVLNRIDGPVKQSVEIDGKFKAETNAREFLIGEFNASELLRITEYSDVSTGIESPTASAPVNGLCHYNM